MCTVSFVPVNDTYIITSNRDEKTSRMPGLRPQLSVYNGQKLIYPMDADAGGTWMVLKENGDAAILLNGAFIAHTTEPPYRLSRGIILLDIIATNQPSVTFKTIKLQEIEPFTLILLENKCLYEFMWDGTEKYCKSLNAQNAHVWSSATLYDGFAAKKRQQGFASFLNQHSTPTQLDILRFHQAAVIGNKKNDQLVIAGAVYETVSITSILLTKDRGNMKYIDLKNKTTSEINIALFHSSPAIE